MAAAKHRSRRKAARRSEVDATQASSKPGGPNLLLWYAVLVAATFAVYRPVWHGGLLWDDEAHVIAETLRTWGGLARLWTDFTASQQYYPVAGTAFWIIGRFSSDTLGYHAVNILLHATSAFLFTVILRRWHVPGALIAGAIYALHPVNVESVAWISELKNTLSGACYLAAFLVYLRFDSSRERGAYTIALGLFLPALGSKTVTATLPAAILVALWWQRGRIDWRRDVLPLAPFFAIGIAAGLGTAWIEYHWVGAKGARFDLGVVERILLAGRVVWFYAMKIVWPANLMFNYPRWIVDASSWWQYLFVIALIGSLAGLYAFRHRARAPLAAALFFVGTLFPALGLFNVYPFRFSFVADHFQYLASLGLIAGLAAAISRLANSRRSALLDLALAAATALPLSVMTYRYSSYFADAETLYRETIARNPSSLLAHGNLAAKLFDGPSSGWPEAMEHARAALAIDPQSVAAHNLIGLGLQRAGRPLEALPELRRAVELDPELAEAHYNLGLTLAELGRADEAIAEYERSLEIYPQNVEALHNLANVLRGQKRYAEALALLRKAVVIDPDAADVRLNLADTLQASGDFAGAIAAYQDALGRRPDWGEAWNNLGMALRRTGRTAEARQAFERAARFLPDAPLVLANLASLYAETGDGEKAVTLYERVLTLVGDPAAASVHQQLGVLLTKLGRKAEAAKHFTAAGK
jgi:protein O-mannosyl-transferase